MKNLNLFNLHAIYVETGIDMPVSLTWNFSKDYKECKEHNYIQNGNSPGIFISAILRR